MPSPISYPITFLPTSDLEETRTFYETIMKFPIALDQGSCVIFRVGKFGYLAFCTQSDEGISNPDKVFITLVVSSNSEVDEWHQYLMKNDVTVTRVPQNMPKYKIYNGFYKDPMGYTIEIQAFDKESQPNGADFILQDLK